MLKFPPELVVHRGNVFSFLYVVGGLLMTVTAGGQCVDVAVRTAQDPANLLRLSKALVGLVGLRYQTHVTNSRVRRKVKRLYFTESFNSLLDMMRKTLPGTSDVNVLFWFPESPEANPESNSANCISARRCSIYYILLCGVSNQAILMLRIGNNSSVLNTCTASNKLQWLSHFCSRARARGDVIFLLLSEETGQMSSGCDANEPSSLTLGLSALCVVLLWMFLPYILACAVICLCWKAPAGPGHCSEASNKIKKPILLFLLPPCSGSLLALELNL